MYPRVVLDLVGFWFPFFVAADIVIILGYRIRRHISRMGLAKYVGLVLWISMLTDLLFLRSGNSEGLPQSSARLLILVSTLSYGVLFYRSKPVISSAFECYVVGVYAEILSDFEVIHNPSRLLPSLLGWGGNQRSNLPIGPPDGSPLSPECVDSYLQLCNHKEEREHLH